MKRAASLIWHPTVVVPIFVVIWLTARLLPQAAELSTPLRLAVALLIAPGLVYLFLAQRIYLGRLDELQRRIQIEALISTLVTILFSVWILHFLQKAGFLQGVEYIDVVGMAAIGGYFLGYFHAVRRYGMSEPPSSL